MSPLTKTKTKKKLNKSETAPVSTRTAMQLMMTTKVCIQEAISLSGNVLTADTVYDTKY
jgi:hypothetical protein